MKNVILRPPRVNVCEEICRSDRLRLIKELDVHRLGHRAQADAQPHEICHRIRVAEKRCHIRRTHGSTGAQFRLIDLLEDLRRKVVGVRQRGQKYQEKPKEAMNSHGGNLRRSRWNANGMQRIPERNHPAYNAVFSTSKSMSSFRDPNFGYTNLPAGTLSLQMPTAFAMPAVFKCASDS